MLQTVEFNLSPTEARSITGGMNCIEIVRATGQLTFTLVEGGTLKAKAGDTLRFDNTVNGFSVISDTVGDSVELRYGKGFSLSLSSIINILADIYTVVAGWLSPTSTTVPDESSLAAGAAADVSTNVATGTDIVSVTAMLDPLAPGPVRVSNGVNPASATNGVWLMPGEKFVFYTTARSVVGFRALSWYNPNGVAVNASTLTVLS